MTELPNELNSHIVSVTQTFGRNIPRLRSADMVLADPDVQYLVRGILPRRGVAAIYGPPASGKTFIAMDLIFRLASGASHWFGIPMRAANVVYIALEGHGGIKNRIKAWQQHNNVYLGESVQIWDEKFRLDNQSDIEELAQEAIALLGKGCVIVVDTLAQSMAGFDENSSSDMGAAIGGAQQLASRVEGLVVLIHHSGKDASKGMRGHSSLLGAVDASIEVNSKPNGRRWKVRKSKDGEAGQEYDFDLHYVDLGTDPYGEPTGSCVISQAIHSHAAKLGPVAGKHRIATMAKLKAVMDNGAGEFDLQAAAALVAPELAVESKRQLTVAKSTIDSLIISGHLVRDGENIIVPTCLLNESSPPEPPKGDSVFRFLDRPERNQIGLSVLDLPNHQRA